jgi:hypothetical protein
MVSAQQAGVNASSAKAPGSSAAGFSPPAGLPWVYRRPCLWRKSKPDGLDQETARTRSIMSNHLPDHPARTLTVTSRQVDLM